LRSSFLSGALLLASFYILLVGNGTLTIGLRASAQYLIKFHSSVPLFLAAAFTYITGSLYITALEGAVDWIHHKTVLLSATEARGWLRQVLLSFFCPLSDASRHRLRIEAESFYRKTGANMGTDPSSQTIETFVQGVFADVLWMDGKLTGSPLRDAYNEFRAEGEFRLGIGLLLPLGAAAAGYSAMLGRAEVILVTILAVVISIPTCKYGLYYYRRAHSFLAHHIADGILLTPSMETLKRAAVAKAVVKYDIGCFVNGQSAIYGGNVDKISI
jgi:hypothetical protein